jgi:hypothetical protein
MSTLAESASVAQGRHATSELRGTSRGYSLCYLRVMTGSAPTSAVRAAGTLTHLLGLLLACAPGCAAENAASADPASIRASAGGEYRLSHWFGGDGVQVVDSPAELVARADDTLLLQTHEHLPRDIVRVEFDARGNAASAFFFYVGPVLEAPIATAPEERPGVQLDVAAEWQHFSSMVDEIGGDGDVQLVFTASGPAELRIKDAVVVFR